MASLIERLQAKLDVAKESGVDLTASGTQLEIKAGTYKEENGNVISQPAVIDFPSVFEGEPILAGIQVQDLILTEATVGKQEKGEEGSKTGDWMLAFEMTIAAPGAKLGVVEEIEENGEKTKVFLEHPIYGDPEFSAFTDQTPLIFTQLLRANFAIDPEPEGDTDEERAINALVEGPVLIDFKRMLDEAGFIPRKFDPNSSYDPRRRRMWSIEAENKQSGAYGADLEQKVATGIPLSSFFIRLPDDERPGQFVDMFQSWEQNRDDALSMLQDKNNKQAVRNGRKLVSSFTGATRQGGSVYSGRATVGQLSVQRRQVQKIGREERIIYVPETFSFWSRGSAPADESTPRV